MIIANQGVPRDTKAVLADHLITLQPRTRGTWQSTDTTLRTYEADNVILEFTVPDSVEQWQWECDADQPWSENHFQERVCGHPLNPAPTFMDWPWHSPKFRHEFKVTAGESAAPFSHTYPERIWPKYAVTNHQPMTGLRYEYGDLEDVIALLRRSPFTRQAFLPIWFPEDTGSTAGQRVPCTLGYHFIRNGAALDCKYFLRSCDITRHYSNDIYMAGRLLQYISEKLDGPYPYPGKLTVFISNLHMFTEDEWRYRDAA